MVVPGKLVKQGQQIFVPIYCLHHDPEFWDEPEVFRPERWLDGSDELGRTTAFMPFGGSARLCVGEKYTIQETKLTLVEMLRRYTVKLAPDQQVCC